MKGLEALERLYCAGYLELDYVIGGRQKDDYDVVEKELKALEIIKALKPFFFYISFSGKHYLETIIDDVAITQNEYNLLKEVLTDEH